VVSTDLLIECRDFILTALIKEMARRGDDLEWIDQERRAVSAAATVWANRHGIRRAVTADDVERIEVTAVGHSDYATMLALYVAEYVLQGEPR
jgi:hypothetical protein